jgi:hypothetical protein
VANFGKGVWQIWAFCGKFKYSCGKFGLCCGKFGLCCGKFKNDICIKSYIVKKNPLSNVHENISKCTCKTFKMYMENVQNVHGD